MKRIIVVSFALVSIVINLKAQSDVEKQLKEVEAKVKLADENPNNARMQYDAAFAIIYEKTKKEKADVDIAKKYASKAVNLALKEPTLKDTTLALSYDLLGSLYLKDQSIDNTLDFWELAIDAYEKELGKYDPVTIGSKLAYSNAIVLLGLPHKGFSLLLEAFNDNENAPMNKRIINMDMATILFETTLENLIAEQTERFRYALPEILFEGEKYYFVQTPYWSMGKSLLGWIAPSLSEQYGGPEVEKTNTDIILLNDKTGEFRIIGEDEESRPELNSSIIFKRSDPRKISFQENNSYLKFFPKLVYNQIYERYLEFKSKNQ